MTYSESVQFLYSLGNEVQTAKLGLERITTLLDALGRPHRTGRFVHVAGTNGKGSTSAMIEAGLRAAGVRTGLYTSPHLSEPTERIQIAGEPVSQAQFAEAFTEVHEIAEKMLRAGEIDLHPTYFESVTAMAFLLFATRAREYGGTRGRPGRPIGCHERGHSRAFGDNAHRSRPPGFPWAIRFRKSRRKKRAY